MPKINSDVIQYIIKLYEDEKKDQWVVQRVGNYVSSMAGSANSSEIQAHIDALKPVIDALESNLNNVVEVLKTLGYIGRISQQTKLNGLTYSDCHRMAYAACSYIHYLINSFPEENKQFKQAIDEAIVELEAKYKKLEDEYNVDDEDAIKKSNLTMDLIICDLATLGQPKRLLIANRIKVLYGNVEMPTKTIFNGVSHYNSELPLVLHHKRYFLEYLVMRKTDMATFINRAQAEFKEDAVKKKTDPAPQTGYASSLLGFINRGESKKETAATGTTVTDDNKENEGNKLKQ